MKLLAAGWLACLLFVQEPTTRKPPPVTIRVDTLFTTGYTNRWHTLILEVTNQTGSDQQYVISADLGWTDRAVRTEKFAPKVRKRMFLYLPAIQYSNRINIRVEDSSGKEILKQDQEVALVSGSHSGNVVVPVLMDRPPAQFPSGFIPRVIPEELFPDRWIGLDGVPSLIIRDYRLDALLPAQRAALVEWVRRGGQVVLYPGSNRDWLSSPAVQELAPVILGDSSEVDELPDLEKTFGPFRERPKFAVHQFKNGEPLGPFAGGAVRFATGRGSVVVVPFDLERAPFDSWPGTQALRQSLASSSYKGHSPDSGRETPMLSRDSSMIHRAATVNVNRLPPFGLLLGLTLLYLITVGPVNFIVLRRLRMTVRLVFTIPAISAVFLGLVVLSGYILRGTSTVTFEICVMDAQKGSGIALEHHYMSLFAPSQRSYDIVFGEGETGRPQELDFSEDRRMYRGYRHDEESTGPIVYDQTDRWTLRGVTLQQWQTRAFVGDSTRAIGGGVTFRQGTELEVTNRTPYTITRGWAVEKEAVFSVIPFGEVPAGETRRFPLNPDTSIYRRYDWMEAESLEERLVTGWLFNAARGRSYRPFLLCVLDRMPDEIGIDAGRSSQSQKLSLLQVGSEP